MNFHTVKRRYFIAFSSKPLSKRCFYGRCIFPRNLKQRLKVFAQGCVENYSAEHKTFQYSFSAYKDKVLALYGMKNRWLFRKYWTIFLPVLSEYRYEIIKISHCDSQPWHVLQGVSEYLPPCHQQNTTKCNIHSSADLKCWWVKLSHTDFFLFQLYLSLKKIFFDWLGHE